MDIQSVSIDKIMNSDVKVETEDQNIHTICKIMSDNDIGSVIIINNNYERKPVGIMTERDIINTLGRLQPMLLELPVKDLMSSPLITISPKSSIYDAITLMNEKKIRRIPIAERNNLLGIVTEKDVFDLLINNKELLPSFLEYTMIINHDKVVDQFHHQWLNDIFHT